MTPPPVPLLERIRAAFEAAGTPLPANDPLPETLLATAAASRIGADALLLYAHEGRRDPSRYDFIAWCARCGFIPRQPAV